MKSAATLLNRIQQLDPDARVLWSEYTRRFYVSTCINESDGVMRCSLGEHRPSADEAVVAIWTQMERSVWLTIGIGDERRDVFWNPIDERWQDRGKQVDATHLVEESP